jgi:hypothetical protein
VRQARHAYLWGDDGPPTEVEIHEEIERLEAAADGLPFVGAAAGGAAAPEPAAHP